MITAPIIFIKQTLISFNMVSLLLTEINSVIDYIIHSLKIKLNKEVINAIS